MTNWDDCVYVQLSVLTVVWRLPGQLSIRDILLDVYSHSSLKDILKGAPKVFCEEVVAVAPLMIQNLKGGGGGLIGNMSIGERVDSELNNHQWQWLRQWLFSVHQQLWWFRSSMPATGCH